MRWLGLLCIFALSEGGCASVIGADFGDYRLGADASLASGDGGASENGGSGGAPARSGGAAGTSRGGAGTGGAIGTGGEIGARGLGAGGFGSADCIGFAVCEDFEDGVADGWTPLTGAAWTITADGANHVYSISGGNNVIGAGDATWTNQVVEVDVKPRAFNGTQVYVGASAYVRFVGTSGYVARLRGDGTIVLQASQSGTPTDLGGAFAAGITPNAWYHVRLEAIGTTIALYLNGALAQSVTDTMFPAGHVALGVRGADADFDNVRVTLP